MNKVLDLMCNFESALLVVGNMKDKVSSEIEYLTKELSECNSEVSDLLHYCELVNFNAIEAYVRFKELKEVKMKIRQIKIDLANLYKVKSELENKSIESDISSLLMSVKSRISKTVTVDYKTRIREDLQDKISQSALKINENGGL